MESIIKQCVAIDVSKDTLDAVMSVMTSDRLIRVITSTVFENSKKSIKPLVKWIEKFKFKGMDIQVLVEATGVYHEMVTYALFDLNYQIAVVMPNKVSNYIKSTNVRTTTDKISARMIAEFGLHKNVDNWVKPSLELRSLKALSRERVHLQEEKTIVLNRKHAYNLAEGVANNALHRSSRHILLIKAQIKEIEQEMHNIVNQNPELKTKISNLCSIRGVGFITATGIIAETDGFALFMNQRQLVCYAGYDVVSKSSGTSVKTKGKISHRGNKYIRRALHFPALSAARDGSYFASFYDRLFERQQCKMMSYTAIQRKLLILIYTLWTKNETYDLSKHNKNLNQAEDKKTEHQSVRNILLAQEVLN